MLIYQIRMIDLHCLNCRFTLFKSRFTPQNHRCTPKQVLFKDEIFIDFDEILYKPFSFLNEKGFLCRYPFRKQ